MIDGVLFCTSIAFMSIIARGVPERRGVDMLRVGLAIFLIITLRGLTDILTNCMQFAALDSR